LKTIRIATRGSDLALTQTRHIAARIERELECETELVVIRTTGDRIQDRSLAKIGGKGLFIKEIEEALLDDRADVAVHSAKDVPAQIADGCALAAYPERVDPRDALASRVRGTKLADLPEGARVGTGSTRRVALLRAHRPDLVLIPMRGNVPTRLAKMESDELDAVVLACAGLDRLGLADKIDDRISTDVLLPAVGQGLLALETRIESKWHSSIQRLEDLEAGRLARAERAYQRALGGDCSIPLAGFGERMDAGQIRFRGLVSSLDGSTIATAEAMGKMDELAGEGAAEAFGQGVAANLLESGGRAILDALAEQSASGEPGSDD
jgi:hydroxymethylbilane synthase